MVRRKKKNPISALLLGRRKGTQQRKARSASRHGFGWANIGLIAAVLAAGAFFAWALMFSDGRLTIYLKDGGRTHQYLTWRTNAGEFLTAIGAKLDENDTLSVAKDAELTDGETIEITRAYPIAVQSGGNTEVMYLSSGTVGDALDRAGVTVKSGDEISELTFRDLEPGMKISHTAVDVTYKVSYKTLDYDEIIKKDDREYESFKKVEVEGKDGKKAPRRTQHNEMSNRKIAEEIAIIQAWIEQNRGADTPVASRRQRAYQIFNDEKAFDGKHGERLIRRMTEKGISMQAIKVAPNRPVHFTGFFTLGADKPFIMVENLDTYDEIVKLLRGRKHAKLFGIKVGGVIFGGGCKASVSHALDDYLAEIGYRFNYVYYVGDIDREGARIVEQARNANVVEIRLHAGMYRAMLAEHKRRVKAGGECEPAAANQGVPQNLAATIKDLPMVTRVQFRNVLREGGRIPQEILMTADYRDGDSGSFDRMLNN